MSKIANRTNWLDYLRSFITLLVVAHHSSLAYTTFAHFNKEAYILSTHPIVDTVRWKGLDIFEDFNDIFFMSLMFLISGIFIVHSLEKKGIRPFIRDRFRRLFIPFAIGVTLLMPIAYYPAYFLAHGKNDLKAYIVDFFTVEAWPVGPPWFIWVLFFFNLVVAGCYPLVKRGISKWGPFFSNNKQHAVSVFFAWFILTWIAYIPFMLLAGPDTWTGLGPFDFQVSRMFLYFCYFLLGVLIGAQGLNDGIFSEGSGFVKKGPVWLVCCLCTYAVLKFSESPLKDLVGRHQLNPLQARLIYRSLWVLSCTLSAIAFLTTFRKLVNRSHTWWGSLSANAYGIYLIHYIFVVWCQYYLLDYNLPAVIKFFITFVVALLMSWLLTHWLRKNTIIKKYL